jgi:hypothetical protein
MFLASSGVSKGVPSKIGVRQVRKGQGLALLAFTEHQLMCARGVCNLHAGSILLK